jgi:hypothetical protein
MTYDEAFNLAVSLDQKRPWHTRGATLTKLIQAKAVTDRAVEQSNDSDVEASRCSQILQNCIHLWQSNA